jgi:hypothetical protein
MLLFPADALQPRRADEHFADEARAARTAGFDVVLVDHDALCSSGGAGRAVVRLPKSATGSAAVYRGWMLGSEQYEEFAQVLAQRNIALRTSPEQYRQAHELPGWYPALAAAHRHLCGPPTTSLQASHARVPRLATAQPSCVTTPSR